MKKSKHAMAVAAMLTSAIMMTGCGTDTSSSNDTEDSKVEVTTEEVTEEATEIVEETSEIVRETTEVVEETTENTSEVTEVTESERIEVDITNIQMKYGVPTRNFETME